MKMIAKWSAIRNNKNIYFAALLILIMLASITGATYAWFIEENKELNAAQFTAGTVKVDLDENHSGNNPEITNYNGCKLYIWRLKNMGTKSSYVRIWVDSDEVTGTGDTAWAYLEGEATPNNQVSGNPSNAWGWTNRIANEGLTTLDLYAGAGKNDLSKGILVGEVTVDYATSTIRVHYQINSDSNYIIGEAHLWLGDTELPTGNNNKPTAAPGQFPYKNPVISEDRKNASFVIENHNLNLPFYVAAHAADDDRTEMVQPIEIGQGCEGNWFYHEGYYYYGNPDTNKVQQLIAGQELTFCLLVCLPDKIDYDFEIQIEAVQSTNNAIEAIGWPQEVW